MKIKRNRWVLMRNNRTEIWCGLARAFYWKSVDEIGDSPLKTYLSKTKALSSCSSWTDGYEAVEITETIESADFYDNF